MFRNKGLVIVNGDTDSITVSKKNQEPFTKEEQESLLKELNSLFVEAIKWEDDGYYEKVLVVKAKNYILFDGKKLKIKGNSLKATTKPLALKEFILKIAESILFEKNNILEIYNEYVKEALAIKDIKRWSKKITITEKVLNPQRTNEQKILNAITGKEFQEGDKLYFFYKQDDSLCLIQDFNNDYNKIRLIKSLWDSLKTFENLIDIKTFPKYHLKKQQFLIESL